MKPRFNADDRASSRFLVFVLSVAFLAAALVPASAQQVSAETNTAGKGSSGKELVEEWVYRVQYGHKDEWLRIFKKYQLAILEKQKQLGFVK